MCGGEKNDAADAAAICEAVSRPNMRFVPIKSVENQGFLMLHRARGLLVRQRTMTACAIRAHFAEFGIIVGQGRQRVEGLVDLLDDEELALPATARMALAVLVNQLKELDRQVDAIERELAQIQRVNPVAKLLLDSRHWAHNGHDPRRGGAGRDHVPLRARIRGLAGPDA